LADYDEAIRINPREKRYYLLRSYIYETQNDVKNSMADTEQVLTIDPNNVEAKARKDRLNRILEIKKNQEAGLPGATPIPAPPQTPRPSPSPKKQSL
jgi:tetratricopeptide (TPR) repeat protein